MSKEIADWKADLAAAAEKVSKTESAGGNVISLKSGIMTYMDQAIPNNELECVIVSSTFARTWFDRPYSPDDKGPPNCFSNALEAHDLIPHENVLSPPSTACSEKSCEYAVFGSALQGAGPACKTRRKLMVMPLSGLDNPAEAEMAVLTLPPTSGKNYAQYAKKVADSAGLPPWGVKTKIIVKPHAKRQFEVTFEAMEPIGKDETLSGIHSRIAEAEGILMTPYTYDAEEEEAPAKPGKTSKY